MVRAILVFAIMALTVGALASYAQDAAWAVSAPASYVQVSACPVPCPVPCPTCPPLGEQKWTANLTSLPIVACPSASGNVDFQLNKEGTAVRYWVHVRDLANVNGAQIRLAAPGSSACDVANAPVVANLYDGSVRPGCTSGRLSRGNITACDLTGPLQGQPLSALVIALTNGTAIATVSTQQHPCGEIAGLAAPTTGQTVACYTGAMAQCNLGLNTPCQVACPPAPAPTVVCAPVCPVPVTTVCVPVCP